MVDWRWHGDLRLRTESESLGHTWSPIATQEGQGYITHEGFAANAINKEKSSTIYSRDGNTSRGA